MTPETVKCRQAEWRTKEWGGGSSLMALTMATKKLRDQKSREGRERLLDLAGRFPSNREMFTVVKAGSPAPTVLAEAVQEIFQTLEELALHIDTRKRDAEQKGLPKTLEAVTAWQDTYRVVCEARYYVSFGDVCRELCREQRQYGISIFRRYEADVIYQANALRDIELATEATDMWRKDASVPNAWDVGPAMLENMHWLHVDHVDDFVRYFQKVRGG